MSLNNYRLLSFVFFIFLLVWNIYNFGELVFNCFSPPAWSILTSEISFNAFCHRNPEKLFYFFDITCRLCSRCTGIYFGALIISVVSLFIRLPDKSFRYFWYVVLLNGTDAILYNSGAYGYNHHISFTSGFLFGSAVFYYFRTGIQKLFVSSIGKQSE